MPGGSGRCGGACSGGRRERVVVVVWEGRLVGYLEEMVYIGRRNFKSELFHFVELIWVKKRLSIYNELMGWKCICNIKIDHQTTVNVCVLINIRHVQIFCRDMCYQLSDLSIYDRVYSAPNIIWSILYTYGIYEIGAKHPPRMGPWNWVQHAGATDPWERGPACYGRGNAGIIPYFLGLPLVRLLLIKVQFAVCNGIAKSVSDIFDLLKYVETQSALQLVG